MGGSWQRSRGDLSSAPSLFGLNQNIKSVREKADVYTSRHETGGGTAADRAEHCQDMVNQYYDLSTDFYLFGWGDCFHFAPRFKKETRLDSIVRHEHFLAASLALEPDMKVLDAGCGVGGPARNIARLTRAKITGLNNNDYQIMRGNSMSIKEGVADLVHVEKGDFMNLHFEDESYDAAYAIEATCHASDRVRCYSEIFRVLKPGAAFSAYEWCMTPDYDPTNATHRQIKHDIEVGNGLPDILTTEEVLEALEEAGFEVEAEEDLALTGHMPWYYPFLDLSTMEGLQLTRIGMWATHYFVRLLELFCIAPAGTSKMHTNLITGAYALIEGGESNIFTVAYYFRARKPATAPRSGSRNGTSKSPKARPRRNSRDRRRA